MAYLMSTPHIILFRNESKNDLLCGTAKLIYLSARLTTTEAPSATLNVRLSTEIEPSLLRVEMCRVISLVSGISSGRIVRL